MNIAQLVAPERPEEAGTLDKLEEDVSPPVDIARLYLAMGEEPVECTRHSKSTWSMSS